MEELITHNSELRTPEYTDDNIRHLDDMEHIRVRSGMYIGRLGDGEQSDDGIYVLLKEVMDNSIDEFKMGAGKKIEVTIEDDLRVRIRDYGRGIPQGKLIEAVSKLNTGGKYDSKAFKKSVGLNGVGLKAVNALSSRFEVASYRDGKVRRAAFEKGQLVSDVTEESTDENGTGIFFEPDDTLFLNNRGKKLTRVMIFTIIKQAAQRVGINKNISPHTFRHSFATQLLEGGANLRAIQAMLGHEDIGTTEIYMHVDKTHLRREILEHHPRNIKD